MKADTSLLEREMQVFEYILRASSEQASLGSLFNGGGMCSAEQGIQAVREFLNAPPIRSRKKGLDWFLSEEKREFDLELCGILIPLVIPVVAAAASFVVMEDGSKPPIFGQERMGPHEQLFLMLKIRTMFDADGMGPSLGSNDPRATKVGRILRATIIDELPQLWNIYRGDMTWCASRALVKSEIFRGKEPPRQGELDLTMEEVLGRDMFEDWYYGFYTLMPPGLVSPFGNKSVEIDKDREYFKKRAEYDLWYREHGCLALDLKFLERKLVVSLAAIQNQLSVIKGSRS